MREVGPQGNAAYTKSMRASLSRRLPPGVRTRRKIVTRKNAIPERGRFKSVKHNHEYELFTGYSWPENERKHCAWFQARLGLRLGLVSRVNVARARVA